jgi:hypothetical protein
MTLFINSIAANCAGMAVFRLPTTNGGEVIVKGFLTEEPNISMGNSWESAIPDISSLNTFSQIAGEGSVSWVSTSKAAWKSTAPITVDMNFYLITYLKAQLTGKGTLDEMPISKQAAYFAALAAVMPGDGGDGFFNKLKIGVHGGYKPNYFQQNGEFTVPMFSDTEEDKKAASSWKDTFSSYDANNAEENDRTIQCIINGGGRPTIWMRKMLLEYVNFTPSTVRTGYWQYADGGNASFTTSGEPLYIRVNLKLRLMHAATTADAIRLFTGKEEL